MNKLLSQFKPPDATQEEWEKSWNNAGWTLEPLYRTILYMQSENNKVKKDDFECPNHYAKLVYQAGFNAALERIADMLPDTAKPN